MIEKPLLSGKAPSDLSKLRYPLLASPKLDGIRCLIRDGRAVTRKFKDVPNLYIHEQLSILPDGMDGELLLSDTTAPFSDVTSAVMSRAGEPDFVYAVFDYYGEDPEAGFADRLAKLEFLVRGLSHLKWLQIVPHYEIGVREELVTFIERCANALYEGAMVRDPKGCYKFGRSTVKEGILLKIKSFADEEAEVIGFVEQMRNENELEQDALGHAKRSTAKAGKVGKDTLGALRCRFPDGAEFEVGTGFDDETRRLIWKASRILTGKLVKIKHQPPPGGRKPGVAPRFPVFLGFRED